MSPWGRKPIRVVLQWQALVTILIAAAALVVNSNTAISALLGGLVSIVATAIFGFVAKLGRSDSAGLAVIAVLRAEAVKVLVIALLLWLVMTAYRHLVPTIFIATFVVAVLIQSMAFFVRER
ncbi:MAG: ATP synthase subunit I [Betaproteobacteria bacterium]|nr:ATP synthase subunit I [Betaproteobacteria bacterium]